MENYMDLNRYCNMCNMCNMPNQNYMHMPYYEYKPNMGYGYQMINTNENNEMPMNYDYYDNYEYNQGGKMMRPMTMNYTPLHKMVYEEVNLHIKKIMMSNMGNVPKSMSMDMYKKELNEMTMNLMKKENEIKRILLSRDETSEKEDNNDRLFCPYCQGLLGNMLGFVFLNSLINRGCRFCY